MTAEKTKPQPDRVDPAGLSWFSNILDHAARRASSTVIPGSHALHWVDCLQGGFEGTRNV